jgi:NADH dehydrogenase/NADH:ubiquinone oxidoreductase subunit G
VTKVVIVIYKINHYFFDKRRFYKFKRVVSDKDLGPIVKTVMTRCIHCTRCIRFATEIAGVELGILEEVKEVGTYVDRVHQNYPVML